MKFVFSLIAATLAAALAGAVPLNSTEIDIEYDFESESSIEARATVPGPKDGHIFTFVNKCKSSVHPAIADTRCGYSPRCNDASKYSGPKLKALGAGKSTKVHVNKKWVGRVFNSANKRCGAKGENCTLGEFNLDTGNMYTPQAYDISNIQGFTQSMAISAKGCAAVKCTSAKCACNQAYKPGDMSGCGNDSPVRACGAGSVAFTVTFCP